MNPSLFPFFSGLPTPIALPQKKTEKSAKSGEDYSDKRRKHKVLTAADNIFLIENVPSYVDKVSGTVNWSKLLEDHPKLGAGRNVRQIAERWKQLKQELPSMKDMQGDETRDKAVRKATGWLIR